MARWRLLEGHYLNVPGTEWEYQETDRDTGRRLRKVYPVPLYLNPNNAEDQNYPGEIIVSHKYSPEHRRDIVFAGPPTPNMEPIDEEAEQISQSYVDKGLWKHPIESLNMTYSQSVLSEFEKALIMKVTENVQVQVPNVSESSVGKKQFEELQGMVKQLMEQNASLQAQLLEKKPSIRRI